MLLLIYNKKSKLTQKCLGIFFLTFLLGFLADKKNSGNNWQTLLIMPEHAQIFSYGRFTLRCFTLINSRLTES